MLHYSSHGSPDLPPLCFLHGFMGSAADWSAIVDRFSEDYFCLTVDLPGHGESLNLSDDLYSMEGTARALAEVFDAEGIERCTMVGYSMGGRVGLYFSLGHPSRIERLVLESVSPGLRTEEERANRRRVDEERAERIDRDLCRFLEDWYRQPLFASLSEHDLVDEMVATRKKNDPAELTRALRGLSPGRQPSLWERLEELAVPTLLLTGALDSKYDTITEQAAARIPSSRRVLVTRAGHNVHAERPQVFMDVLKKFLRATSRDGAPSL